ncbi:MipA/OmpV family protein [Mesobaculum littorinae]|uniref:MipA/OmpV family protein n=1 Tax=Mesobaculum littorinae TaxID=2486419 RepID=A0A438AJA1_9RHOB|nr:MipA/OmpV family protein [Mesobaculum littorinae]RVV98687.1 MipA/OmpV family protein [Mesobaculum littorinae]
MSAKTLSAALGLSVLTLGALPAAAQDYLSQSAAGSPDLIFNLRGGVAAKPSYFGSDDLEVGPDLGFSLGYARLGGFEFGNPDPTFEPRGVNLRGSFRYVPGRDDDDDAELTGLDDVDSSIELGLGVAYTMQNFEAFADMRYGVTGHNTFVADLGADAILRPTDRLTLTAGPRVFMGTDRYADTYFGVSGAESLASGLDAYEADGGILSAGVEVGATYQINDDWGVEGAVAYQQFVNDAEDSPIVRQGSDEDVRVRLGITRKITLDF